ncbi:TIGR00366 family protein [Desulfosarcina widdelii]|uniref:TIGR00366 family protein n=1 Tax=Desulfosarcina widdelii TaxID=947919 RepID=UPI0014783055|nr:TIGR00366 family protein [Desulfosarcina widdelii]
MNRFSKRFIHLVECFYSDQMILSIEPTLGAFLMSIGLTDASSLNAVDAKGDGFKSLIAFTGIMSFTLIVSIALVHTRPATHLLQRVANIQKIEFGCFSCLLYSQLMGLMEKASLTKIIDRAFSAIYSKVTLAFWAFIPCCILDLFVLKKVMRRPKRFYTMQKSA